MNKTELVKLLINQQFKIIGKSDVSYDDVKIGGKFEKIVIKKRKLFGLIKEVSCPWYQYFTFDSKEQFEEWRNFCIKQIIRYTNKSKIAAENEFAWINLAYGLKQNYKND